MTEHELKQIELTAVPGYAAEPPVDDNAPRGLGSLIGTLRRRWMIVLGVWVLVAVPSALIIHSLVKQVYVAVAQIAVAPSVQAILYRAEEQPIPLYDTYMKTQANIALSQDVLSDALASPLVRGLPWVKNRDALATLRSELTIDTLPGTQLIQIQIKDRNPEVATALAKVVLDAYMARAVDKESETKRNRRSALMKKKDELRGRLDQLTNEIKALAEPFGTDNEKMFEQMREVTEKAALESKQDLDHAELRVLELDHQLKQLSAADGARVIPEDLLVARDQTVSNDAGVRYLQKELDEAVGKSTRLQEALPPEDQRVSDAKKQVDSLRNRFELERKRALADADRQVQERIKERAHDRRASIDGELSFARQNRDLMQQHFKEITERSMSLGRSDLEIKNLREDKESTKQEFDRVDQAVRQIDMESQQPPRITIASSPEVRPEGIDDKRRKLIPAAIVGAFMLAMGIAFIRDRRDTQLHGTQQIEVAMGPPLLGAVPSLKDLKAGRITKQDLLESYRLIRTTLAGISGEGRPPKSILITSAQACEGKTSLAVGLALSLAELGGRVLLIDGDIQAPQIGKLLKLNPVHSLRDALLGHRTLAECIGRSIAGRFDVLVARSNGHSARGVLSTQSAIQLVHAAADAYDHIVIDSPPSLGAADALAWAQSVEAVIVSMLVGHSDTAAVRLACQRLASVRANVVGSVIANVSTAENYYSYSSVSRADDNRSKREAPVQLSLDSFPESPPHES